jgi:potassium uptake TrkH family protein
MNRKKQMLNIRERIFKWFFIAVDRYRQFVEWFSRLCRFLIDVTFALFILGIIFYVGFGNTSEISEGLKSAFRIMFTVIFLAKYIPGLLKFNTEDLVSQIPRALIFLFVSGVFLSNLGFVQFKGTMNFIFQGNNSVIAAIILMGITELSGMMRIISSVKIPPALIFSTSFLLLILIGSGLLMMPKSHVGQLSYLDALFTSVSAVCVTGLIVVDTANAFTTLGKIIVLCLIQTGGLGIMTFTGFFGYIFTSASSFRDKLLLKELFSADNMNNLLKLLTKIILFTFLIEAIGALIIYSSLGPAYPEKVLFSVFHSVSAFCNAGFSTLPANLATPGVAGNTTLHFTIALLIIFGGIGFPVLMTFHSNLKHAVAVIIRRFQGRLNPIKPVRRNVSARIVLFMTLILIVGGTFLYYVFESGTSMKDMAIRDRIITSMFGSISARTAGFNITDISAWGYPTIFLMMFLMWIGASPGSTGGGIKTTTFAVSLKNAWNYIRGRDTLIIWNREISGKTISRVLTIVFLSLAMIFSGFMVLLIVEPGRDPVKLLFECFSAFGTVGLSLADSSSLSSSGKIVDIVLMFIGRVGPLTLLTGIFSTAQKTRAGYPGIDILIN